MTLGLAERRSPAPDPEPSAVPAAAVAGATGSAGFAGAAGAADGTRITETGRAPAYVVLFLAAVVADTISGNSKLLHFPLPPQRMLLAGAIVLLVLDVRPWRSTRLLLRPVTVVGIAFVGWLFWSASVAGTLTTSLGLYAMVDRLLVPMAAFAFAPVIFATRRDRLLLLKVLTGLGIYLGFTAAFEVFGPHALVFPRFIVDPHIGIQYGRARGPFVESEADGLVMSVCGFAGGLLAWQLRGRWRRAGLLASLVCALGVLLTLTRSNWIGAILATGLAFGAVRRLRKWLPALIVGGGIAVASLLAFSPALNAKVTGRAGNQRSVLDRLNTDDAALRIIDQHPLTGVGWERFIVVSSDYVRQARTYPITNIGIEVHNVFLGRAAELGLPGALLFIGVLLLGPVRALFRPAAGEFAGWRVFALGVVVTWSVCAMLSPLPYSTANLLFWLIPGVALTPYLAVPQEAVLQEAVLQGAAPGKAAVLQGAAPGKAAVLQGAVPGKAAVLQGAAPGKAP